MRLIFAILVMLSGCASVHESDDREYRRADTLQVESERFAKRVQRCRGSGGVPVYNMTASGKFDRRTYRTFICSRNLRGIGALTR